jgi:hypothetical protein
MNRYETALRLADAMLEMNRRNPSTGSWSLHKLIPLVRDHEDATVRDQIQEIEWREIG